MPSFYGGFIPAWARDTPRAAPASWAVTLHPRVGGEHQRADKERTRACGSSPRWRGTRYAGMAGAPTGLDYAGCRAAATAMGLAWREVFGALRLMEGEWLSAQAERRERA